MERYELSRVLARTSSEGLDYLRFRDAALELARKVGEAWSQVEHGKEGLRVSVVVESWPPGAGKGKAGKGKAK